MNYSGIICPDVANGRGVRVSLFVSGCDIGCKGCFNKESQDLNYGAEFTDDIEAMLMSKLNLSYITGLSILGGEPFHEKNQEDVLELLKKVREEYPEKDVWVYTGYLFEDLVRGKIGDLSDEMLDYIDILVDGRFIESQKQPTLRFRGSKNQRIIDVQRSYNGNGCVGSVRGCGDGCGGSYAVVIRDRDIGRFCTVR